MVILTGGCTMELSQWMPILILLLQKHFQHNRVHNKIVSLLLPKIAVVIPYPYPSAPYTPEPDCETLAHGATFSFYKKALSTALINSKKFWLTAFTQCIVCPNAMLNALCICLVCVELLWTWESQGNPFFVFATITHTFMIRFAYHLQGGWITHFCPAGLPNFWMKDIHCTAFQNTY